MVIVRYCFLFLLFFVNSFSTPVWSQDTAAPATQSQIQEKQIEVAIGIDHIEKLDFDYHTKIVIGNDQLLKVIMIPNKREMIFQGLKPGRTTVTVRDNVGDVRVRYTIVVTATGKSNVVSELRELIGDVEGLEIGIKGGKVFVGGEIVVPNDIGRVSKVLASYPEVLTLIEMSPQTQRVIAKKMADELARNNLRDVSVRVVNKAFWLEGVVSSPDKKDLAMVIARAYLPPKILSLSESGEGRFAAPSDASDIIDFIAVNPKKEPQPAPKLIKISSQFVELSKSYNRIFSFRWAPLMGADNSQIAIGPQGGSGGQGGDIVTRSSGTLSATISNLFPKLNSARTAGYARVIQSAMVITRNEKPATITKDTSIPFAVGSGDFTKASSASVGITVSVEPRILEEEKIEMGVNISIKLQVGSSPQPIVTNNSVNTTLVIKSTESAAVGGVVQNQSTTDYDADPNQGAEDAPSPLFNLNRSKAYVNQKSQYVIFLTPEIIESASVGTEEIRKKFRRRE
ncbi:MAG: pilus assembly protein N-terminal domain-containing protein [Bacteriovoracaceae bacterium]